MFFSTKSENFISLKIFKFLIEILSFKFSKTLNILDLSLLISTWIRLSLFNSFLIFLIQIDDLKISNHEINCIYFLISYKTIIEIKISTIIKIRAEKKIKTEIKTKTETEIIIAIIKIKIKVKIINKITIIINKNLKSTVTSA